MQKHRRIKILAAAVVGALGSSDLLKPQPARAATHTWEGAGGTGTKPNSGYWSDNSEWGGGRPPWVQGGDDAYTNRATTEIVFGGSDTGGISPYWAWNDYPSDAEFTPTVNVLRFNSTSTATNTISSSPSPGQLGNGGVLNFVLNNTTTPRITQDTGGAFDVDIPLFIGTPTAAVTLQLTGGGTGRVSLLQTITHNGSLDVQGGNTWISGSAQLTSQSAINFGNAGGGGSLTLDHSRGGALDRLADNIAVNFGVGGGTLAFVGASGGSTETVGNITVSAGANRLSATSTSGGATLQTGTLTRTGGVVDFAGAGGTLGSSATSPRIIWANTPTLVNGIIGGWATVNGVDFASYGANGVTAYTGGYTPLPQNNFNPNTNYEAASSINLTGGGNIFTVRLNTAVAQAIDVGANNITVTGGILKIGAGTTTISGTGTIAGGSGELVLHVNQGALNFNAPFNPTKWTKAGTGGLNLTVASSPAWQTASFSGPVTLNVTADSTISGQLAGAGSLVKNGPGKLTLTNGSSGFSGGGTINAGTVELLAQSNAANISIAAQQSYFGSGGNININNGSTLKLTSRSGGTISVGRTVVFGTGGSVLDLTNTVGGVISAGNMPVTVPTGSTSVSVIKWNGGDRGFSTAPTTLQEAWSSGDNVLRFSSFSNTTGPVRVELSKAGGVRQSNGGGGTQTIPMAFTIAGPSTLGPNRGFSDSGLDGTVNPAQNTNTAHVFTDNANVINYSQGLKLEGSLQMSVQGAARAVAGDVTLNGVSSGNPAFVTFNGRGTGTGVGSAIQAPGGTNAGSNPLWLNYNGTNAAGTLRIQEGAIASMDLRIRVEQNNSNGVFMEGPTVIENGGTLRFTQSWGGPNGTTQTNVGYNRVNNTITGQGTTLKESNVDLFQGVANTSAANLRLNGVQFNGTNVAVIVNGVGLGGLRVNGLNRPQALLNNGTNAAAVDDASDVKIANLLTQSRLAGLTGTGGFLTPAAQGATFTLPSGSEWAANVPVGLRATTSNATGTDVALPSGTTWSHDLHVDAGAQLGVSGVSVNGGRTTGLGALAAASGVTFNTGSTVAPGAAGVAGTLGVTGSATLAAGSTLRSEVTGATNGTLAATGNLTITGSTLQFVPNTVTSGAHRWDVATGTIVGKFASAPLPADETTGSQRMWSLMYEPTRVSVGLTIGGDADFNGLVNFDDLLALAKAYNKFDQYWNNGEFTRDGLVNFDDLLVLAKNYNKVVAGAVPTAVPGATAEFNADMASAFAQAAVPEPGTLGLIGIGLMGALGGRRRRRQA